MSPQILKHYQSHFEALCIHPDAEESEVAKRFKTFFPEKVKDFQESLELEKNRKGLLNPAEFDQSKKRLLIKPFEGKFFKQCPGGNQNSACCNYFVLNLGAQCHFNCSYCYLQSFLNSPFLVVYSNIEDALSEISQISKSLGSQTARIGTGEVIDSLGLDPITNYSKILADHIKDLPNLNLELKTKSHFVDHLLEIQSPQNITASWSINPDHIIQKEEHGTASLQQRLEAALKLKKHGFKIGFHIDPVIWHEEWQKNYGLLVEQITSLFSPQDVPYISLGALRFQPEQKHIMKERFERSSIVNQAEVFKSKDGKLRYDKDLRAHMFKSIIDMFKSKNKAWRVFLCMESPETWLSTYGDFPKKVEGLEELFSPKSVRDA